MKKKSLRVVLLFVALQLLTACPKEKDDPQPDDDKLEKGFVKGKVIDTQGKPLKGVEIIIDNTYLYNSNLIASTNDEGNYKVQLGFGTFLAYAKYKKTFNGKQYKLNMHPETEDGFAQDGAVRNFEWKLTGKLPGNTSLYYGGAVEINKGIESKIYDSENIEFTLTPIGQLIDGSNGKVLKMKHGLPRTDTYSKLVDIPIGRYSISAVYKGASGDKPVKLKNWSIPGSSYSPTLEFDFEPQTGSCFNCVILDYVE